MPWGQWLALLPPQLTIFALKIGPSILPGAEKLADLCGCLALNDDKDGMNDAMMLWGCSETFIIPYSYQAFNMYG